MGTRGQWSQWGRGSCEGWSLELGLALRGSVVRQERINQPPTWLASLNAGYLGEYLDRASAMTRVEADIEYAMQMVLDDWEAYREGKKIR